jgi:triacylglycerol lipase
MDMTSSQVVLLHGFLGFVRYGPISYFRGVADALRQAGLTPFVTNVPSAGTIAERAEALAQQLFPTDISTFALVAHSMGGLDARYLIAHLDPDHRIKSLVTVATPHRGTPVATWSLEFDALVPGLIRRIGNPALGDLTPSSRAAHPIPDRADVAYASYAAHRPITELPLWLRPFGRVIPDDNDGLVSVDSARWGTFHGVLRTDHIEVVGWSLGLPSLSESRPFDHLAFWKRAASDAMKAAQENTD